MAMEAAIVAAVSDREEESVQPQITTRARTKQNKVERNGRDIEDGQATLQKVQQQLVEQTRILKDIAGAWSKQEAHNKAMETEISRVREELQEVRAECQ